MRGHEVVVIDEGQELAAGQLHELVALLAHAAMAAGIDEGQPFDGVRIRAQLRFEQLAEAPEAVKPLGNRRREDA